MDPSPLVLVEIVVMKLMELISSVRLCSCSLRQLEVQQDQEFQWSLLLDIS